MCKKLGKDDTGTAMLAHRTRESPPTKPSSARLDSMASFSYFRAD
jgi:hypothetical protein